MVIGNPPYGKGSIKKNWLALKIKIK
jgi:hypothetical protein